MFGKRKSDRDRSRPLRKRRVATAPPSRPPVPPQPSTPKPPPPQPSEPAKGIDAPTLLDLISGSKDGSTRLSIVHSRPWAGGDDKRLQQKIKTYLAFIEQGQIDQSCAEWFQGATTIELAHMDPIPDVYLPFLESLAQTLVSRHGVGFRTTHFVDADNGGHAVDEPGPAPTSAASALRGGAAFTMYVGTCLARAGVEGLKLTEPYTLMADERSLSTQRLWGTCKAQGAEALATEVDRWVSGLLEQVAPSEHPPLLVPLIRPLSMMQVPLGSLPPGTDPEQARYDLFVRFCGPLVVCYALDHGRRLEYVMKVADLAKHGLSAHDLQTVATDNLRSVLPEVRSFQAEGTCIGIAAGGDYEPSLLLLDDFCESMAAQVDGDLVACVPARDLLFLTGSQDAAGLADLKHRLDSVEPSPGTELWPMLMVWRQRTWQEFEGGSVGRI